MLWLETAAAEQVEQQHWQNSFFVTKVPDEIRLKRGFGRNTAIQHHETHESLSDLSAYPNLVLNRLSSSDSRIGSAVPSQPPEPRDASKVTLW